VRDLLLVFLKWPTPGRTKTRLIPLLGEQTAADLYWVVAEACLRATAPRAGEYERLLCFTPREDEERVAAWFPDEERWPQPDGDLGERMAAAFDEAFRRGAHRAALVGTDVPFVACDEIRQALQSLDRSDVALGPARDGGYYLVGLRHPQPLLFTGIPWGSGAVLDRTLHRASSLGLGVHTLDAQTDLDTVDDLRAEWPRLAPILDARCGLRDTLRRALFDPPGH
jgi:rSAM/selenodomain-associated transferase 1